MQTHDNLIMPFTVDTLNIRGRVVRLGSVTDTILRRHAYPEEVAKVVAEAMALAALLGSSLKSEGRFQIQTKSEGPIESLVVDYAANGAMRAYARYNEDALNALLSASDKTINTYDLLGSGILAMTIDPGGYMKQYQGIVTLDEQGFQGAANRYFEQSEQIPTGIRLAVAQHFENGTQQYRAGGIMAQHLPSSGGKQPVNPDISEENPASPDKSEQNANDWQEARLLLETVEDHELIDPRLPAENLLFRLYHEQGVKKYSSLGLFEQCQCSHERVLDMISRFPEAEREDMYDEQQHIGVTCQFCSRHYDFAKNDINASVLMKKSSPKTFCE